MIFSGTRLKKPLLFVALACLLAALWYLDWVRFAIHLAAGQWGDRPAARTSLDLASYHVEIEARPIEGLKRNASGLTYNPVTGTLFAAINRPPMIAELSTEGQLLRRIALPLMVDSEGITHVEGELFAVSDESHNQLHWLRIRPGAQEAEVVGSTSLALDFSHRKNLGFEGVSWDEVRGELLVVNEKWPQRVLAVRGLDPGSSLEAASGLEVSDWSARSWLGLLGRDLASLTTHAPTGNLLTLSEESAIVTEYSRGGEVLGVLPLWRGLGGLRRTAPQAEGIAIGPDEAIYIISEPNLFYVFRKSAVQEEVRRAVNQLPVDAATADGSGASSQPVPPS